MTQIILPDSATSQLAALPGPTSICDSSGHVLGTYIPEAPRDAALYAQNPCPLSDEELARRRNQPGKPLSQFWEEMGAQP